MLVAVMVITGLICVIGSAAAASYIWVESNVKGVGHLNSEYEVDTEHGIATGIEMQELEAGSGLVTKQKWTLEVNPLVDDECVEGLIEEKEFDVEYFPITYQNHSYDQKWMEKKCVKNYDIGAVTDANFIQCEKLQKKETVVTYGDGVETDGDNRWDWWPWNNGNGGYELDEGPELSLMQTVSADVLGISHIGFAAKDPGNNHHTIAYGKEETIGQFNIEKTIEIKLNCSTDQIGDWLGCP